MTRPRLILPGLAVALACLAGCGSSTSSSSSAQSSSASTTGATTTTTSASNHKTAGKAKHGGVPSRAYHVRLTGKAETPAGASKGVGRAQITLHGKTLKVCWTFKGLKGFDKPALAHIHSGAKGTSGNVLVPLSTGPKFKSKGCVQTTAAIIRQIAKHPSRFYVNIHSKKYPGGAVRAQL